MVKIVPAPIRPSFDPGRSHRQGQADLSGLVAAQPDPTSLSEALAQMLNPPTAMAANGGTGILANALRTASKMPAAVAPEAAPSPGIIATTIDQFPPAATATAAPAASTTATPAPIGLPDRATPDLSQVKSKGRGIGGLLADIAFGALLGAPSPGRIRELKDERRQRELEQQQTLFSRQDAQRQQDHQWHVEDRDAVANRPQYFMAGRDRVAFDPTSGESKVVYDAPEDYQSYAGTLGLNPGDEGYDAAVQDFVLRGAGPSAQAGRRALVGVQQNARLAQKAAPTYRDMHPTAPRPRASDGPPRSANAVIAPILLKMSKGLPITDAERQTLAYTRPSGGRQRPNNPDSMIPGTAALPVTVTSPEQARLLPRGTVFRNPQGKVMTR